jgi:hypothetical protein
MEYALVPNNRALVVIEKVPELIDVALDHQIVVLKKEIEELQSLTHGLESQIGRSLNALCFKYPEIARRLYLKLNTLRELQGQCPVDASIDPFTMRNKDGVNEEEERAKLEAEAEAEARKAIDALDDKDLTPEMRKEKFLERKKKERCKRLFLKIAKLTHPDKIKDAELHGTFHEARTAYAALQEDELEVMLKNVQEYTAIKFNRGKFRDFKRKRIEHSKGLKQAVQTSLDRLKTSMAYQCMETYMSGNMVFARIAYDDFIDQQCYQLQKAIDNLREQMRMQDPRKFTATSSW